MGSQEIALTHQLEAGARVREFRRRLHGLVDHILDLRQRELLERVGQRRAALEGLEEGVEVAELSPSFAEAADELRDACARALAAEVGSMGEASVQCELPTHSSGLNRTSMHAGLLQLGCHGAPIRLLSGRWVIEHFQAHPAARLEHRQWLERERAPRGLPRRRGARACWPRWSAASRSSTITARRRRRRACGTWRGRAAASTGP